MKKKNTNKEYLPKFSPYYSNDVQEPLKAWEVMKIVNNIDKETKRQDFWRTIATVLLIAFAIAAIALLTGYVP